MRIFFSGKSIFLVLEKGEEVVSSIKNFCEEENITAGFISGIGALEKVQLGVFNVEKKEYEKKTFKGPYELLSLSGNVSIKDGEKVIHLHAILGNENFQTIGGHLFSGDVAVTCEIFIYPEDMKLIREFDEETGLYLITKGE